MTDTQAPAPTGDMVLAADASPRDPRIKVIADAMSAKRQDLIAQPLSFIWEALAEAALTAAPSPSAPTMGVDIPAVHLALGHLYGIADAIEAAQPWKAGDIRQHANTITRALSAPVQSCVTTPLAGDPIGYLKPDGPWTMGDRYIDAKSRTEDWMLSVFTVPVYGAPLAGEAGAVEGDDSDMALIGRSFMASLDTITAMDGPYKDWTPAEDPAELVIDLYNDLIEARESALSLTSPKAETETGAEARRDSLPIGHFVLEQADIMDGTGRIAQTVSIGKEGSPGAVEYQRIVHADEAYVADEPATAETASERERAHLTDTEVMEWLVERCGGHSVTIRRAGQRLVGWSAGPNAVAIADLRAALSTETGR